MGECERKDEERLVADAQAGDGAAFGRLATRYRSTAISIAVSVCGNREIAEDVVQDSFLTAFRALRHLQEPSRFGPWLATIVRNRARRLAQDKDRVRSIPLHLLDREVERNIAPSAFLPPSEQESAFKVSPKEFGNP